MAFTVRLADMTITADTADEAIALVTRLAGTGAANVVTPPPATPSLEAASPRIEPPPHRMASDAAPPPTDIPKKRPQGHGTVGKINSGWRFRLRGADGARINRGGYKSRDEAEAALAAVVAGAPPPPRRRREQRCSGCGQVGHIVRKCPGPAPAPPPSAEQPPSPLDAARRWGSAGGKLRASRLTPQERSSIAARGAAARWGRAAPAVPLPPPVVTPKPPIDLDADLVDTDRDAPAPMFPAWQEDPPRVGDVDPPAPTTASAAEPPPAPPPATPDPAARAPEEPPDAVPTPSVEVEKQEHPDERDPPDDDAPPLRKLQRRCSRCRIPGHRASTCGEQPMSRDERLLAIEAWATRRRAPPPAPAVEAAPRTATDAEVRARRFDADEDFAEFTFEAPAPPAPVEPPPAPIAPIDPGPEPDYPDARPITRGECERMPRPCPFVSCSMHLAIEISDRTGRVLENFPGRDPDDLDETCALDLAARGGLVLDIVGAALGLTRERARQIETGALVQLQRHRTKLEGAPDQRPKRIAQ